VGRDAGSYRKDDFEAGEDTNGYRKPRRDGRGNVENTFAVSNKGGMKITDMPDDIVYV
jgi:hypothetical protein